MAAAVGADVERSQRSKVMIDIYIALGANLGEPQVTIRDAIFTLSSLPQLQQVRSSSLYRSSPMGPADQPPYVNAVITAKTELEPLALLDVLQLIEQQFGRQRERHWGPRTLDLDLLLYGQQSIELPRLTVPHPGLAERDFVLVPLAEVAPNIELPDGRTLQSLLVTMQHHDLQKIT